MKRVEIIANRSVQNEIIDGLETVLADFHYTLLPMVHGKGRQLKRLGTPIWPEENFMLISYVSEGEAAAAKSAMALIKTAFPNEGIKLFVVNAEE